MTVKELIEELKKYPQDIKVYHFVCQEGHVCFDEREELEAGDVGLDTFTNTLEIGY